MGKTNLSRAWAEAVAKTPGGVIVYPPAGTHEPLSREEFNREYLSDFFVTSTAATTVKAPPLTLEAIKAAKAQIEAQFSASAQTLIMDGLVAAQNTKEKTMDDVTKQQLEIFGKALTQHNDRPVSKTMFDLAGPAQLTIKTRQGQYKKKAFLGDEKFVLASQYIGKKDMILVFKNTRPVDYAFMEMPLDEAMTQLRGFKEFADEAGGGNINATLANIETVKTQEKRAETATLMEDPEFASW